MALDLSSLRDALAALNASLGYLESDLAKDPALKDQFRAAAIQAFEFTYELAFKFMKRQLEEIVAVPSAVDEMTFMQVVRSSAEAVCLRTCRGSASIAKRETSPATPTIGRTRTGLPRCCRASRRTLPIC